MVFSSLAMPPAGTLLALPRQSAGGETMRLCASAMLAGALCVGTPVSGEPASDRAAAAWDIFISGAAGNGGIGMGDFIGPLLDTGELTTEFRASGAYVLPFRFGAQGDFIYENQITDIGFGNIDLTNWDGAVHLFFRDPGFFLIGGFFQQGYTEYFFDSELDFDRIYVGGEAQLYLGNMTLYVQGGHQSIEFDFPTPEIEGYFIMAQARIFLTPNWKVHLGGGYDTYDFDGLFDVNTITIGAGTEYRFESAPLSLTLTVDRQESELVEAFFGFELLNVDATRALVGLKLNLGSATLIERDRNAASLDPLRTNGMMNLFGGDLGAVCGCVIP
jgi:hypothetical protein